MIIEVSMTVSLQHTQTNQVVHDIPGDEIQLYIYPERGQLISDGERLGEITGTSYRTLIRQFNGGTVWVNDATELDIIVPPSVSTVTPPGGIAPSLIAEPTEVPFPHQTVMTSRENIRRGQWIYGVYDPVVPAAGTVLKTEIQSLSLRWLPDGIEDFIDIEDADYSKFKVCLDVMDSSHWTVGDRVVMKNGSEACSSYGISRLGRERYCGFDVNTLIITSTSTTVKVQWQDLTETVEDAKNLTPYLLVDDHDVWPGEYIARKDINAKQSAYKFDTSDDYNQIGVVQCVNSKERTAKVRWFRDTENLVSDNLSTDLEDVSFYELLPPPLISYGVGDYVYLPHAPFLKATSGGTSLLEQGGGMMSYLARAILTQGNHQLTQLARSFLPSRPTSGQQTPTSVTSGHDSGDISTTETSQIMNQPVCDWYGQITSLNLDGSVTVRLGFFDPPVDVVYPASAVIAAPVDDDDDDDDDDLSDADYDAISWSDNEDEVDYLHDGGISATDTRRLMITREASILHPEGGEVSDGSSWEDDEEVQEDENEDAEYGSAGEEPQNVSHVNMSKQLSENSVLEDSSRGIKVSEEAAKHDTENNEDNEGLPERFLILDSGPGSDHHYESELPAKFNHRRLARERNILNSSLPDGIYVRTYANRLDLFRALIIGPSGTPYEMAPFMFDIQITSSFPREAPLCFFHSWSTNGIGRVNPNLYEDGKICLSLLGTWPGETSSEKWNSETSSILQLLVSLQALVLNKTPYYNEAGYDAVQNTDESAVNAELYSERTFVLSRGFVLYALENNVEEFQNVIEYLYFKQSYLRKILEWEKEVLDNSETDQITSSTSDRITRVTKGARILLLKNYQSLKRLADATRK